MVNDPSNVEEVKEVYWMLTSVKKLGNTSSIDIPRYTHHGASNTGLMARGNQGIIKDDEAAAAVELLFGRAVGSSNTDVLC
jgi:hypothetical protein